MRRSPKLRPTVWDGLAALGVVALAAVCALAVWRGGETAALTAVVSVDGQELERLTLAGTAETRVYTANGYTLTLELCPEGQPGARMAQSDCPTQDCVHTGTITRGGQSIVCLPGRFIVRLEGGAADSDGPDVIIG